MPTLRDRGLGGGRGGEGTAGTQPTYLGEGSSTRPWRPLGPEPREEAPAGATRVTAGTRTRASYAALRGSLPRHRQQQRWNSNPRARPPAPGIGALGSDVSERLPCLQDPEAHAGVAGPGRCERTASGPGRRRVTRAVCFSPQREAAQERLATPPVMLCVGKAGDS